MYFYLKLYKEYNLHTYNIGLCTYVMRRFIA